MHKLQNGSQVSVRPQRKPLVGLGGYFSESNDQGAPSYPGQDWFNDCTDEFLNALAAAGIEYEHGRLDHLARMISGSNFAWLSMPIGSPFPLIGALPPTDSDAFRYVVLTDADPYNDGVLFNKEVSGTAPNLVIKYTINLPDSPLHGSKIEMLNSMEAVISPSVMEGKIFNDTIRNITGRSNGVVHYVDSYVEGAISAGPTANLAQIFPGSSVVDDLLFDASLQVPTGLRNQTFAVGAKYLMRIK
ncbi:phage tail protein [Vibrio cholerae]|nr:phage tail protein [Vibrio cholerae]